MPDHQIFGEMPPVTVEKFELTHEISLYIREKGPERGRTVVHIEELVPSNVADEIVYQLYKVLANAHNTGPLLLPPLGEKEDIG